MKKSLLRIFSCMLAVMMMTTGMAFAKKSLEERKAEIHEKVESTLEKLYEREPAAERIIDMAPGYAVFVNTGSQFGLFGSAHGRGIAFNSVSGEETYMKMGEYKLGLGIGIKEYALIFVFGTEEAADNFANSGWKFSGDAAASATDGEAGGAIENAVHVGDNIWMYQMTTEGLSVELNLRGTEYYRDKSYYPEEKEDKD